MLSKAQCVTRYIQTGDLQIDPLAGLVWRDGEAVKIRPKTFELLVLLVEARGALVSKEEILSRIWDDVSVDEQVVFQSVKELRKLLQVADAIKTVPRKGYAWTLPVQGVHEPQAAEAPRYSWTVWHGKVRRLIPVVSCLVIAAVAAFLFFMKPFSAPIHAGSVIVLPVANSLTDTDHRWVRYGAMDHLIHRLPVTDSYGVYQAGDVLDVVKRAGIANQQFSRADVAKIFAVTGAALVVEVTLAGTPREYQILYRLHERGGMEKGALLTDRINLGLDQLAEVITQKLGQHAIVEDSDYRSDFANEMIATALELMQTEDFASAEKFLAAAAASEPGNIVAKRLLVQVLVQQKKSDEARRVIDEAVPQAGVAGNRAELLRLHYWAGVDRLQAGEWEAGLEFLRIAKAEAEALKEWLYLGYIAELRGHAQRAMGNLTEAVNLYEEAIDFHKVIQCPYGQALGHLNLARIWFDLGEVSTSRGHADEAVQLIESRELHSLEQEAAAWVASLNEKTVMP